MKYYKIRKFLRSKRFAVIYSAMLVTIVILGYLSYSSITKLQLDQNNLEINNNKLELQYSGLQANYRDLQYNTSIIESQLDALLSNYSNLQSQQDNLHSRYNDLQFNYSILQSQQDNLHSRYNDLQFNYSILQSQYNDLQAQHTMLELNYSAFQAQYNILQANHSALQAQHDMLQASYYNLQVNYTQFLADYSQLRTTPFSYLVFTDGNGNYYAENGTTKTIEFSGTDFAAILNAVLSEGKTCHLLPGEYYLNSPINAFGKNDVSISGSDLETSIIQVSSDICAFNITGTGSNAHNARFSISNIAINSTVTSSKPALFIKYMNDIKLSDVSINQFNVGYDIEYTEKVYIYRCKAWSNKTTFSTGFKFVGYSIDTFLVDTLVLHNQPSGVGYFFDNCDSITMINAIANPTVSSYGEGGYGFVFFNCHWVNFIGTISDGNGSHGYYLSSGFRYYFNSAWAGSNFGNGLQSDSASQISLSGCSFYNNHMDGIKLSNAASTTISNTISKSNTKHGLEVSSTNGITVTSSVLTENGKNGIFLDVGNIYVIIQNNNCNDNLDSSFDIYISTPSSSDSSLISNNFGRIYQTS